MNDMSENIPFLTVCAEAALPEGAQMAVEAGGRRILLIHGADGVKACDELCSHMRLSLEGGRVMGDEIICPHHNARFCLKSGEARSAPARLPVDVFAVRVMDGQIEVQVTPEKAKGPANPFG